MKPVIFLLLLMASFSARSQSLKDLLYSGKLKKDSSTVIRKDEDLSARIDTTTKKAVQPETAKVPENTTVPQKQQALPAGDTAMVMTQDAPATPVLTKESSVPARSNTRILKDFTDSIAASLKGEALSSKKIKKDTYYLTMEYELAPDGSVEVINVVASPENTLLQDIVKERLTGTTLRLAPANGQEKKVKRKYNFTVTKD